MWGEDKIISIAFCCYSFSLTPGKANDLFGNLECLYSTLHKLYNLINIPLTLTELWLQELIGICCTFAKVNIFQSVYTCNRCHSSRGTTGFDTTELREWIKLF